MPNVIRPVCVLLLAGLRLSALDPSLAMSQYAKKHWQVEDGLPQNYVTSISQSADGYLLAGTSGGVARFDGLRFTPIVLNAGTGITREWINAVQATPDGCVWIASRDAGLFLHCDGVTTQRADPRTPLKTLLVTRGGKVVGLGGGFLWAWSRDGVRKVAADLGYADPSWQALTELPDESLVAAGDRGVLRCRDGRVTQLLSRDDPRGTVLSVQQSRGGGVWLGTASGLFRLRFDGAPQLTPVRGVRGPVVSIVEDREGLVWAATWGQGLYRVTPRGVNAWTTRDGLPDDFVHDLFEDSEGNLWIGSRAGLSRWKNTPVVPYGPAEGLNGQYVSAVSGAGGTLWMGTWRSGLHQLQGGAITHLKLPSPDLDVLVRAIASSPGGTLWVSDWKSLLERTSGGWRIYNKPELGYTPSIHALAFDAAGGLWVGADSGLYRYPGGRPVPGATPVLPQPVRALLLDHTGVCWAGGTNGLWRIGQGRVSEVSGLPHPGVTSLSEDGAGDVWVTTRANGLCRLRGSELRVFDNRHGLPPLPFYASMDDRVGSLWLSSPAGIYSVPLAQFDNLLAGRRTRLEPAAYTQDDGLRTTECQSAGQPSAWRDSDGALWFPTVRGVVRIRPAARRTLPPPVVVVESVESTKQSHVVRFTAPRLSAPGRIEFRYRIEDLNPEWILAGGERALRYNNLPAGRHRLLISAREQGGRWSEPAGLDLIQPPRFHETWWFRTLSALASCGLVYLIYRWRVLLLKGRYRAVLADRNRIAREWHDTLLAGFSAIGWQLDATLHRLRDNPQAAASAVETARTMVQHYRAEARRVIWDLRSDEPAPQSLGEALAGAAAEITRDRNIACSVQVEGQPVPLPGNVTQNLLRICQEAASNSVRHGAPTRIHIRLRFDRGHVEAVVQDDGAGFDPEAASGGHFGLEIMRERARTCGGELQISSRKGCGTTVAASIPYPPK